MLYVFTEYRMYLFVFYQRCVMTKKDLSNQTHTNFIEIDNYTNDHIQPPPGLLVDRNIFRALFHILKRVKPTCSARVLCLEVWAGGHDQCVLWNWKWWSSRIFILHWSAYLCLQIVGMAQKTTTVISNLSWRCWGYQLACMLSNFGLR